MKDESNQYFEYIFWPTDIVKRTEPKKKPFQLKRSEKKEETEECSPTDGTIQKMTRNQSGRVNHTQTNRHFLNTKKTHDKINKTFKFKSTQTPIQ